MFAHSTARRVAAGRITKRGGKIVRVESSRITMQGVVVHGTWTDDGSATLLQRKETLGW